jgi:hypothetical protein
MGDSAPKPSSSVKLVLLGEAAVGKVRHTRETIAMAFIVRCMRDRMAHRPKFQVAAHLHDF